MSRHMLKPADLADRSRVMEVHVLQQWLTLERSGRPKPEPMRWDRGWLPKSEDTYATRRRSPGISCTGCNRQ